MTQAADKLSLIVTNDLSELERVSRDLEEFGRRNGLSAGDISAITLAADEILTNIVLYAFDDREKHDVHLHSQLDGDTLTLEVTDDGQPFDPTTVPAPPIDAALEERAVGGLGIHIARRLMEMSYRRHNERNILTLKRRLTAGETTPITPTRDKLRIDESEQSGTVIFEIAGRLDTHGAVLLENRLRNRLEAGNERFVFDCNELDSLSSAGLRVLLIAAKESAAVALAATLSGISETIEIAGLSQLLPSYVTRAEALTAVAKT